MGEVIPGSSDAEARQSNRRHCVWSLPGGDLAFGYPRDTRAVRRAPAGLLDIRWAESDGSTTVTLRSPAAAFCISHRVDIGPGPRHGSCSAQTLLATASPIHWALWNADEHGDSGFELLKVDGGGIERLCVKARAM